MDPMTIMSLVSSGIGATKGLAQMGIGIGQLLTNKKPEDIQYQMPAEVLQMLAMAKARAANPFGERRALEAGMQQNTASAVANVNAMAGGSGAGMGAIADLYGKQLGSLNQIAIKEFEAKRQAEAELERTMGLVADYRDRTWDFNVKQPYDRALGQFYSQRQAGFTNMFGGIDAVSGSASDLAMNDDVMEKLRLSLKPK